MPRPSGFEGWTDILKSSSFSIGNDTHPVWVVFKQGHGKCKSPNKCNVSVSIKKKKEEEEDEEKGSTGVYQD